MYLGIQNKKIVLTAQTEQELTNNQFIRFDEVRFTEDEYVLYNGEYILQSEAEERQAEKQKQQKVAELQAELDKIDLKSIRSQRAIQAGTGTEEDIAKLAELEQQAEAIRQQIRELINNKDSENTEETNAQ